MLAKALYLRKLEIKKTDLKLLPLDQQFNHAILSKDVACIVGLVVSTSSHQEFHCPFRWLSLPFSHTPSPPLTSLKTIDQAPVSRATNIVPISKGSSEVRSHVVSDGGSWGNHEGCWKGGHDPRALGEWKEIGRHNAVLDANVRRQ